MVHHIHRYMHLFLLAMGTDGLCHFLFLSCISFTANVSQQSAGCKFFSAFRVIENLRPKNSLIDLQILILKHIKDHIFDTAVRSLLQILLYRLYGNLRRLVVRKAEYPSGYTAERHTFQPVCRCQFQTGQVTDRSNAQCFSVSFPCTIGPTVCRT